MRINLHHSDLILFSSIPIPHSTPEHFKKVKMQNEYQKLFTKTFSGHGFNYWQENSSHYQRDNPKDIKLLL